MQETTMNLLDTILRSDGSVDRNERKRLLGLLKRKPAEGGEPMPSDRLLRRAEVARLLGRSPKAVDRLAERGILKKVVFPTCKRGAGFRLSDIERLIAGTESQSKTVTAN